MAKTQFVKEPRTDADVGRLLATFTIRPDGHIISHDAIEQCVTLRRQDARYRTVTNHWRRRVFQEQRVFLDGRTAEGRGFKALTPDEMVRYSNRQVRAIGRQLKRALIIAATPTDDEIVDPHTRAYRTRLLSAAEQIAAAHDRVLRDIGGALKRPAQLPRSVPT